MREREGEMSCLYNIACSTWGDGGVMMDDGFFRLSLFGRLSDFEFSNVQKF
jgi:hypothetical protein